MQQTSTAVQTTTSALVGIAIMGTGLLAAAAGFVIAASNTGPILNIRATPKPTAHSAVQGARDEQMLGFSLEAKNKGITINKLVFDVLADSDGNFNTIENDLSGADLVTSCVIKNKQTGSVFAGPSYIENGNIITFADTFTLPANTVTQFTINCDLAGSSANDKYIMAFELGGNPANVVARATIANNILGADRINVGSPADVGVNMGGPVTVTVRSSGKLSASIDPTSPKDDIIIAGTQAKIATYKFSSTNEAFTIQKLRIKQYGELGGANFAFLGYKLPDGRLMTNGVAFVNGVADFTGLAINVPAGATNALPIDVTFEAAPINSTSPVRSGWGMSATLDLTTPGSFMARGNTSGKVITEANMNGDIPSPAGLEIRKTRPTITLSSSTPSGAAIPGRSEVLRFNVAADPAGDLSMSQMTFKIDTFSHIEHPWASCGSSTVSGLGDTSKWELKDLTTGEVLSNNNSSWIIMNADGNQCGPADREQAVVGYALVNLVHGNISAGTSHTFSLIVDSTGADSAQDDAIKVEIVSEPAHQFSPLLHTIQWREGVNGLDLINGNFIKNLPITGGTLVF